MTRMQTVRKLITITTVTFLAIIPCANTNTFTFLINFVSRASSLVSLFATISRASHGALCDSGLIKIFYASLVATYGRWHTAQHSLQILTNKLEDSFNYSNWSIVFSFRSASLSTKLHQQKKAPTAQRILSVKTQPNEKVLLTAQNSWCLCTTKDETKLYKRTEIINCSAATSKLSFWSFLWSGITDNEKFLQNIKLFNHTLITQHLPSRLKYFNEYFM